MAPVASVAARKVSAKSFFMDCSFHDFNHRTNSERPFFIVSYRKGCKGKDGFVLTINLKLSCLCDLPAIDPSRPLR
jgi:hypothetical protein